MEREALKLALEAQSYAAACLFNQLSTKDKHAYAVEKLSASTAAIKEALAQPAQEPVAHTVIAGALFDFMGYLTSRKERIVLSAADDAAPAVDAIRDFATKRGLLLDDAQVREWIDELAQPVQQEALYGMNQDDWKDVVAAIAKVRDGRGIYLGCRPADVFQDWFLALGTAKVKKEKSDDHGQI